jgi:hypothetical protein
MGIRVQEGNENVAEAWTWRRDPNFPQQSNGDNCGMVAIVTVTHLARGWQLPDMSEATMNQFRRWLSKVITDDSEDNFEVPCQRCGTTQSRRQVSVITCANKQNCDFARAHLHDSVICDDQPDARRGATGSKLSVAGAQLRLDSKQQAIARRNASAVQHQAQQEADKNKMIVDPLSSSESEKDAVSVTGVQGSVLGGACTFTVKVKAHRGEPLKERADTQAENARQLPSECRQWTTSSQSMTYEWSDNDGVKHVTAWSKAVRNAMLRGGAEFQRQKALNRAANNWNRAFLRTTDIGLHRIGHIASTGAQSDLIDAISKRGSGGIYLRARSIQDGQCGQGSCQCGMRLI